MSNGLMSDSLDRRLGWAERAALNGHLFVCRSCRRARRQLRTLRQAMRKSLDQVDAAGESLSAEARDRIRAALKNPG
jgi:hypothetical protein